MSQGAKVTSVDTLEAFRSALVVYISKARPTLEEVSGSVLRTRLWLENEQRVYWEGQLRLRLRALEEAQQALFSAKLSNLRDESVLEVMAVQRAKRAVQEAEAKLKALKLWNRDFESRVQPMVKQVEKLHGVLSTELPRAIAHLGETIKALQAYADIQGQPAGALASPGPEVPVSAEASAPTESGKATS